MADIFLDGSLAANITDGSYSIANRDDSGSDGNAYRYLSDAYSAAVSGSDTIYARSGDTPISAVSQVAWGKNVDLLRYNNEDAWLVGIDGSHGIYATTGTNGSNFDLKLKNGGAADRRAFSVNDGLTDVTIKRIEIDGYTGSHIYVRQGSTVHADLVILKNNPLLSTSSHGLFVNDGTLTIDVMLAADIQGEAVKISNASSDVTIGQLAIFGGNNVTTAGARGQATVDSGTLLVHNILCLNTGMKHTGAYALRNTAGTFTVNAGIVNGNVHRPWDYLTSGTITMTNVLTNQYVDLESVGVEKICASFFAVDSNHGDADSAINIADAFVAAGAKATLLPDDQHGWVVDSKDEKFEYWVNAGMELGCEGDSSSDMSELNPINVEYTGLDTNVTLVVSGNGTNILVSGDGGDIIELDTSNDSSGTGLASKYIALATTGVVARLDGHADISCTINGTTNSWDDAFADIFEDGVYDLSESAQDIAMNRERFFVDEIDVTQEITAALSGQPVVSYFQAIYDGGSADVAARLKARGFTNAIGGVATGNASELNILSEGFNIYNLTANEQYSYWGGSDYNKATNGQDRLEGFVNVWATAARMYGLWGCFLLHNAEQGAAHDADELGWIIARMKALDIPIKTLGEAAEYYSVNRAGDTVSIESSFSPLTTLASSSEHIGIGTKWWTGANPVGINGEPFSDIDTDITASQSTYGPFHPGNP